jgi:hypothetical protein
LGLAHYLVGIGYGLQKRLCGFFLFWHSFILQGDPVKPSRPNC